MRIAGCKSCRSKHVTWRGPHRFVTQSEPMLSWDAMRVTQPSQNWGAILLLCVIECAGGEPAPLSQWVHPGPDGALVYKTTPAGDRIMDFSHAGYKGGGVALPDVPVKKKVKPTGGEDDTKLI